MKIHTGLTWSILLSLIAIASVLGLSGGTALAAGAASWDARPCLAAPSNDNCTGTLPVAPASVPAQTQRGGGSGVCIMNNANQSNAMPITETIGLSGGGTQTHTVGTLTIWWLASCQSYAANLSIPQPPPSATSGDTLYLNPTVKMTITAHDADTSQDTAPLDNFLGVQHWFSRDQSIGPVAGYNTWTPMIWGPGAVASVCASITFESGLSYSPRCAAASMVNGKLTAHQMIDAWVHV